MNKRFRVAFSFAGEKRDFVAEVARLLADRFGEEKILYDKFHEAEFARKDLAYYLPDLYSLNADLVVTVLCHDYGNKEWCGLEWDAIFSLLKERQVDEVMLCRFDLVAAKGLFNLAGYLELDRRTPEETATRILERLALNEGRPKDYYTNPRPEWLDAEPALLWPVADHTVARRAFAQLLTRATPLRFLSIYGASETGKSHLTNQFLANVVPLPGVSCGRFDFKGAAEEGALSFADQLGVTPSSPRGDLGTQLQQILVAVQNRPVPTLLIFDTFEQAGKMAADWVRGRLLLSLARLPWLRVVIVGQQVPETHGQPWATVSFDPIALTLPSPDDWLEYVQPHRPDVTREFVHQAHVICKGSSTALSMLLRPR